MLTSARILAAAGLASSGVVAACGLAGWTFGVGVGAAIMFVGNLWVLVRRDR